MAIERVNTGDEQSASQAAIAALQYANLANPVFKGHPIKIYYQDSPCLSKDRAAAAGELASQPDLIAVVGPFCQAGSLNFGKLVSDAGTILISAGPLAEFGDQPGWFSTYPSLNALAEAFDRHIPITPPQDYLVIQNRATDQSFADAFCGIRIKNGRKCEGILKLDEGNYDLSALANSAIKDSETLVILMPADEINQLTSLPSDLQALNMIFFDPELAKPGKMPQLPAKTLTLITYSFSAKADGFLSTLPSGSPEVTAVTTFDTYNLILRVLEEASIAEPDGSLVIQRQKMRDAMGKIANFSGLAGAYSCNNTRKCLNPDQFLFPKPQAMNHP